TLGAHHVEQEARALEAACRADVVDEGLVATRLARVGTVLDEVLGGLASLPSPAASPSRP
ncbi:MAG: hypothetical protein M3O01_00455, partial [Pseudomonadota bacterium]|nr:hypothetical protein [Pseudomonadota bacterium]